jgi:hypothetical protein
MPKICILNALFVAVFCALLGSWFLVFLFDKDFRLFESLKAACGIRLLDIC